MRNLIGKVKTFRLGIFFVVCSFLLIISACSGKAEKPTEIPDAAVTASAPDSVPNTETPQEDPNTADVLSTVIAAIGPESTFYAVGAQAYYVPDDLLDQIALTGGLLHYGQTVLYSNSLLFEYLTDQQNTLRELISQIDPSAFEPIEQKAAQEKERSGSFAALIENTDGGAYRFEVYPCLTNGMPSEVIIRVAVLAGDSAYCCGPWDETLFGGLTDMYMDCHSTDEETDNTAYITLPGESEARTLLRYLNAQFVNIVDGVTLKEEAEDVDTSGCDVKVVIGGEEYWLDQESGVVLRGTGVYQLKESAIISLTMLLKQANLDSRIEVLLNAIQSSPANSSNPGDYIREHKEEYEELLGYSEDTLRYCCSEFLKGHQTDLRGHIMAQLCQEISSMWGETLPINSSISATGQAWFDVFKENAEQLAQQISEEELKTMYRVSWLFLEMMS